MSRMNRRQFTWIATGGLASATLVACSGDAVTDDLTPTQISDVEGAPPTLGPQASPPDTSGEEGGGEEATPEQEAASGDGGSESITLEAIDPYEWSMFEFEVSPGQEINVVNTGGLQHNFNVDDWDIATADLNGGEEETVTVPDDAEVGAEVEFYCSIPGHREGGMEGTITVVEAGAAGGEEATPADEATPVEEEATPEGGAASEDEGAAGSAGEAITVGGLDTLEFDPSEIEASPGQTILFINEGFLPHDFNVDELDMHTALLNNGEEEEITVPDDAESGSEYAYYCSVAGHREGGMEGTITIA